MLTQDCGELTSVLNDPKLQYKLSRHIHDSKMEDQTESAVVCHFVQQATVAGGICSQINKNLGFKDDRQPEAGACKPVTLLKIWNLFQFFDSSVMKSTLLL